MDNAEAGLSPSDRADLESRLWKAIDTLEVERNGHAARHALSSHARVIGKIEGVKLALDYLRAY